MDMIKMTEWLHGRVNETLMIRKEEEGDIDKVMMKLQSVTYGNGGPDSDDYVNDDRIVLHGEAKIAVESGVGAADLPRDSYEIVLAGDIHGSFIDDELLIQTDRAKYRLAAVKH